MLSRNHVAILTCQRVSIDETLYLAFSTPRPLKAEQLTHPQLATKSLHQRTLHRAVVLLMKLDLEALSTS